MVAEGSGVPAGWYPDPLGLPQLRWWDGGAWTEFTSAVVGPGGDDESEDEASSPVIDLDADDDLEATVAADVEAPELTKATAPDRAEPAEPEPAEPTDPEPVVVPEPFDPSRADPFAAAQATALEFTSRRARRAYERKLALESGLAEPVEPSYARLDTNPVDIQLAGPGIATAAAASGAGVTAVGAADPVPLPTGPVPVVEAPGAPEPAAPQAPHPDAPAAGTPVDGREDILAQSTLAPRQQDAAGSEPRFSLDTTGVPEEFPPARTLIPKRTYGAAAYVLAMLPPLALLAVVALEYVPGLVVTSMLAWGIGAAALVIGVLIAFLDAGALRRLGHERTASPLWALLTPIVYLSVRAVATRRETGHGRAVILAWVLGLLLAGLLVYLIPDLLPLLAPGVTAPWTSPLG